MSISSGILNVSAAPNFRLSPSHSSSESSQLSSSKWPLLLPADGVEGSLMLFALQCWAASIFTCPRWEISTTTVSSSSGSGCFHGSPSILMNVWSAAPLWNSKRIRCAFNEQIHLHYCVTRQHKIMKTVDTKFNQQTPILEDNLYFSSHIREWQALYLCKTSAMTIGSNQHQPMPSISEADNLE